MYYFFFYSDKDNITSYLKVIFHVPEKEAIIMPKPDRTGITFPYPPEGQGPFRSILFILFHAIDVNMLIIQAGH